MNNCKNLPLLEQFWHRNSLQKGPCYYVAILAHKWQPIRDAIGMYAELRHRDSLSSTETSWERKGEKKETMARRGRWEEDQRFPRFFFFPLSPSLRTWRGHNSTKEAFVEERESLSSDISGAGKERTLRIVRNSNNKPCFWERLIFLERRYYLNFIQLDSTPFPHWQF